MLDINMDSIREGFWRHFPLAATIGAVIALELAGVLLSGFRVTEPQVAALEQVANTKALGVLLYTEYLYPVQVAAIILLVALIAAIALTLRSRKDAKTQDPSQQVRVKARDRVSLVKMEAVKAPEPAAAEQEKQA
jgi:NADH-quinone oxidoreductase subunit J